MVKRKITALFLSLAAMLWLTTSAYADDVTELSRETVRIGNHDCWVKNGKYYTIYDNEKYLVINLDELNFETQNNVDVQETMAYSQGKSAISEEIDVSDGGVFNGTIDITNGDCNTPIYKIDPDKKIRRISFTMHTNFIFTNKYKIVIYMHDQYANPNEWRHSEEILVSFSLLTQDKVIFDGSATLLEKLYITFLKEGSSGEPVMNYSMHTVIWNVEG